MANYSELSVPNVDLLGTGVGTMPKSMGADIKFFLAESSFTGTAAQLKTQAYWAAAIIAKTVIPFPMVQEIAPQDVEAAYEEMASGDTYKVKSETRKTEFKFVENVIVHSGMKSYSDRSWNIWYYTSDGYLRCHTKSMAAGVGTFEGLKASRFYVNAQAMADFGATNKTSIIIQQNDVNDWDKEFGIIQPNFDMADLEGVFQADVEVQSISTGATLVVNVKVQEKGTNSDVTGLVVGDFVLKDTSGTVIALTSATETANVYAITATSAVIAGTVSLDGVVTIGADNYQSIEFAFA
ncbi:MAG: hypothetical protein HQ490_01890 [Lutibacter sp.]|nr:hypothetical protein [Lutibacter sp.]